MLASRGDIELAVERTRRAVTIGQALIPTEPENMVWVELTAAAELDLAAMLLAARKIDDAAAHTRAGCDLVGRLAGRDQGVPEWRALDLDCLSQRARVALDGGSHDQALNLARRALAAARSNRGNDAVGHRLSVAQSHKLVGDVQARMGDQRAAAQAWQAALAAWPTRTTETPRQMAIRAELLADLGRSDESQRLDTRLKAIGYGLTI